MSNSFLNEGTQAVLIADTCQVPIEVVDYCGKALRIKFTDKPLVGGSPWCWLDFQNDANLARYYTQVCAATYDAEDGMVLVRVPCIERNGVREFARVPSEVPVSLLDKDDKPYEAQLMNLSSGGALVESQAAFALRDSLTLQITLPGYDTFNVGCQVVHVDKGPDNLHRYGLRFVQVEREFLKVLLDFLWDRLKELFPMRPRVT